MPKAENFRRHLDRSHNDGPVLASEYFPLGGCSKLHCLSLTVRFLSLYAPSCPLKLRLPFIRSLVWFSAFRFDVHRFIEAIELTLALDLKNTTDDALPTYLTRPPLQFKQSNFETDVRLALGYTAVVIAGALFYYDWTQGWESSKPYTAPAVVIYFILNAAFTYWIWGIEKGTIFVGFAKSGEKVGLHPYTLTCNQLLNIFVIV